jgi:hypothetical protein
MLYNSWSLHTKEGKRELRHTQKFSNTHKILTQKQWKSYHKKIETESKSQLVEYLENHTKEG